MYTHTPQQAHYISTFVTFDLYLSNLLKLLKPLGQKSLIIMDALDSNIWTHEIGNGEWGMG